MFKEEVKWSRSALSDNWITAASLLSSVVVDRVCKVEIWVEEEGKAIMDLCRIARSLADSIACNLTSNESIILLLASLNHSSISLSRDSEEIVCRISMYGVKEMME